MTIKLSSLIAATAILALAPAAQASEPVTLDDAQLDEVTAGANPGTGLDDILWEIAGDETYDTSSDVSLGDAAGGGDDGVTGVIRLRVAF